MHAASSLGSLLKDCVVDDRIFTRKGCTDDNVIWPGDDRNRSACNRLYVSARLPFLGAALATIAFAASLSLNPLQAGPLYADASEATIAQLPSGTTLRFARREQVKAALHPPPTMPQATLRKMAEDAATAHTLPVNYFLRLIRQESGFNPNSISAVGAQGIAQFMPATAIDRGLKDPFDPAEALPKSAELLSDLRNHFGNLGLAAAAYNAGRERIRKWLAGEGQLPLETINYVRRITGHDAVEWTKSNELTIELSADEAGPAPHVHVDRLSWEAQLLATLRATSAGGPAVSVTMAATKRPALRSGEAALCSQCVLQSAY